MLVQCFRERPDSPAEFILKYIVDNFPAEAARVVQRPMR